MHLRRSAMPASAFLLSLSTLTSAAIIAKDEIEARSANNKPIPDFVKKLFRSGHGQDVVRRQQVDAICYPDDPILSSMQSNAAFTPWCSDWLDLPAKTTTATVTPTM